VIARSLLAGRICYHCGIIAWIAWSGGMRKSLTGSFLALVGLAWAGGLVLGLHRVETYESAAAPAKLSVDRWPVEAPPRNADGFTVAVFVHPECPCSQATMSALDKLMAHAGEGNVKAFVFAVMPDGAPDDWKTSVLLAQAKAIAGVQVIEDDKGKLARAFGALTSGQTALYDRAGVRVFCGGITDGRGHDGPNAGATAVAAILNGREISAPPTPGFGCSLLSE
jgi:hypothetical protein